MSKDDEVAKEAGWSILNKDDFDTEAMARAIYEHEGFAMDYVPDWNAIRPETKSRLIAEAGALIARYLARRDERQ